MAAKLINTTEGAVLMALVSGREYGSDLVAKVHLQTEGKVPLTLGTVYPVLYKLERKGLVRSQWGDEAEGRNSPRRRYYSITSSGAAALEDLRRVFGVPPQVSSYA